MITLPEICMRAIDDAVSAKSQLKDAPSVLLLERTIDRAITAFNEGNDQAMRIEIREMRAWTHPHMAVA